MDDGFYNRQIQSRKNRFRAFYKDIFEKDIFKKYFSSESKEKYRSFSDELEFLDCVLN